MTVDDPLARFTALRPRLFGIAYRMLGSAAEAEDVLQEAQLRWLAAADGEVRDADALLVTIVSRLALDVLGSARVRRETYVGPWLPEPIATEPERDPHALSLAFLLLLERLSPAERAAFLLAEVFDYSFAEVGAVLGKSEAACRQLAARARKAVRDGRPRAIDRDAHARVLTAFVATCASGDVAALERLLAADVACVSDSGGRVSAARNIVTGANAVARLLIGLTRKGGPSLRIELRWVNGEQALVIHGGDAVHAVSTLAVVDGRIATICIVRNPDKLRALAAAVAIA